MTRRSPSPLIASLLASIAQNSQQPEQETLKRYRSGATEDCECLVCQIVRSRDESMKPKEDAASREEAPSPAEKMIQTVAAVSCDHHLVSVGYSVPDTSDEIPMVAIRLDEKSDGILITADEAQIIAHALIAAANWIES